MSNARNVLVFCIGEEVMHILFSEGAMLRCMVGVPADARLLGVNTDWARREMQMMWEHPSFLLCLEGTMPERRLVGWEIVEHPLADRIDGYPRFIGTPYNEHVTTPKGRRALGDT